MELLQTRVEDHLLCGDRCTATCETLNLCRTVPLNGSCALNRWSHPVMFGHLLDFPWGRTVCRHPPIGGRYGREGAFVLNRHAHWIAIRAVGGTYWDLNSMLDFPSEPGVRNCIPEYGGKSRWPGQSCSLRTSGSALTVVH